MPDAAPRRNWVLEPSLSERTSGHWPPPGMVAGDGGQLYHADTGEPVQIIPRPGMLPLVKTPDGVQLAMPKVAELLGYLGASPAGGEAGALASGASYKAMGGALDGSAGFRHGLGTGAMPVESAVQSARALAEHGGDPTIAEMLAPTIDPMRRSSAYKVPDKFDAAANLTMDNALTKRSFTPSSSALKQAGAAAASDYHTPVYHQSGSIADPAGNSLTTGGTPFITPDPFYGRPSGYSLGAQYTGNLPSAVNKSGAAQVSGPTKMFGMLVRGPILGHTAPNPSIYGSLPTEIAMSHGAASNSGLADILSALHGSPDRGAELERGQKALSDWLQARGQYFDKTDYLAKMQGADRTLAEYMAQHLYNPASVNLTGAAKLTPLSEVQPAENSLLFAPHYTEYEKGARTNLTAGGEVATPGDMVATPGAPSPYQTAMRAAGYTGSRVVDETASEGGWSIAMHDPTALRSANARFNPDQIDWANTLAGRSPLVDTYTAQQQQQQPQQAPP